MPIRHGRIWGSSSCAYRPHLQERQIASRTDYQTPDRRLQPSRAGRCLDQQALNPRTRLGHERRRRRDLREGNVILHQACFAAGRQHRSLADVMHDADDPATGSRGRRGWRSGGRRRIERRVEPDAEALPDGTHPGPDRVRHRLVDERHLGSGLVGVGQPPALAQPQVQDVEQLRRGRDQERQLAVNRRRLRASWNTEGRHIEAGERQRCHRRGHGHAGKRAGADRART